MKESYSARLRDARKCVGYLGHKRIVQLLNWAPARREKNYSLSLKSAPTKPASLVILGRVDTLRLYVTGLGSWSPKFDRPPTTGKVFVNNM